MPPRFVSPPRPAIYISEIAPGEPRNPPSISEIHVSIGSTVSITQQPINGIDNADTILGDARAELVKREGHAGKCVGQLPSARLLLQKM